MDEVIFSCCLFKKTYTIPVNLSYVDLICYKQSMLLHNNLTQLLSAAGRLAKSQCNVSLQSPVAIN